MNCNEVLEQLGDFLDEDARAELCRAIQAHLDRCQDCKVYVDTVKKTIVLYQAEPSPAFPVVANAQLQAALAREYRLNGRPGAD